MSIPILMYHQIDVPPPSGTPLRGLVVSPDSFARQMWLLKCLGYRGLSMRDLEPYLEGKRQAEKSWELRLMMATKTLFLTPYLYSVR